MPDTAAIIYNANGEICRIVTVTSEDSTKLDNDPAFHIDGGCQVQVQLADYVATNADLLALYKLTIPAVQSGNAKMLKPKDHGLIEKASAIQSDLQTKSDIAKQEAEKQADIANAAIVAEQQDVAKDGPDQETALVLPSDKAAKS